MNLLTRMLGMRLLTGAIFSMPIAIVVVWYTWSAYATIDRYRRAADRKQEITLEMFQLALHDELARDFHRLTLPDRPGGSAIATFELSLTRDNLDRLGKSDGPAAEGEANYVKGLLKRGGQVHEVRVRYRGGQPWHFLGPQKSVKVRVDRGDLVDGARAFNLINDPTPFGLEDQIILDLARESGLLTPEYRPVWVRLNNSDLGVYRFEAQPDEGLLRRNSRMPGNMYSGDTDAVDSTTGAGAVFSDRKAWRKVANRSEATKDDERELDRLLFAINTATQEEFAAFAARQIDLDRYALFDALDVVFGGSEHDWLSNHKLYVDPYTGKLEPVAWSFRGFQHEPAMNFVDHPLLIRLKLTPGYLQKRDRAVYELLTGRASVPAIRARVEQGVLAVAPDLLADPWWDAYKLLPKVSRFVRFMPRPMSMERWVLAGELELAGFAERSRYLLNVLEEPNIDLRTYLLVPNTLRIDLTLLGQAAYTLQEVSFSSATCTGSAGKSSAKVQLWADADLDGAFDQKRDQEVATLKVGASSALTSHRDLYAGFRLARREDPKPKSGPVRVESEPRTYTYFATSAGCPIEGGALELDNLITAGSTRLEITISKTATTSAQVAALPSAHNVPRFLPEERSPHVWSFKELPLPARVELGPGTVRFDETVEFGAHQTVHIAPDSVLALGPKASLIFRGPVFAEGPVSVQRRDPDQPYGGIALQGKGTRGSRLIGLRMRGGSRVQDDVIEYPALINLHDSSDLLIEDLVVEGDKDSDDVLHANSVDGLRLHEVVVRDAPVDGIDLELTKADLRGIRVFGAGDDCLDLGNTEVRIRDSILTGCVNNAVSAGEQSVVSLHGLLIAGVKTGVLAKNGAEVRATRSVIWEAEIALKTGLKEVYYEKKSTIGASELFAARCGAVRDAAKDTTIEAGSVEASLPDEDALRHLLVHVLRLKSWTDLEESLNRLRQGAGR